MKAPENFVYDLSSIQQEVWLRQSINPELPFYNIGGYLDIDGAIDINTLNISVDELVKSHTVLNLHLVKTTGDFPQQSIRQKPTYPLQFIDFSLHDEPAQKAMDWLRQQFCIPFQLYNAPLYQFALVKVAANRYYFLLKFHHLIADGWSIALLARDLTGIYRRILSSGQAEHAADIASPAQDNIDSYQQFLQNDTAYQTSSAFNKAKDYWLDKFRNPPLPPIKRHRLVDAATQSALPPSNTASLLLEPHLYQQLQTLAKAHKLSVFHLILGLICVYLLKTTGQSDLVIGLPLLNRSNARQKRTAGLFANIMPGRFQPDREASFLQFVTQIAADLYRHYRYQRLPVSHLYQALGLSKQQGFIDIMLSYEKHDYDISFDAMTVATAHSLSHGYNQNALEIYIREYHHDEPVQVDFEYNLTAFGPDNMALLLEQFKHILQQVLDKPDRLLKQFVIQPRIRPHLAQNQPIQVPQHLQAAADLMACFAQQVQQFGDSPAVKTPDQSLTYRQLNARANGLAQLLLQHTQAARVALLFEHGIDMIVAILAVLKAGKAYVPLAVDFPEQRLSAMLKDAEVGLGLTCRSLSTTLKSLLSSDTPVIPIEGVPDSDEHIQVGRGDNMAYLLYTSGSTGQPKAVTQTRRNVLHFIRHYSSLLQITSQDKLTLLASYQHDAAVIDIFTALLNGATLYPFNLRKQTPEQLSDWIRTENISIYHSTPTIYRYWLDSQTSGSSTYFNTLRCVILGGEAVFAADMERFKQHMPAHCLLVNSLGATESSFHLFDVLEHNSQPDRQALPVGYPLPETEIRLLDEDGKDNGVYGEIAVKSPYITPGYWRRPALNQARFITTADGERVYRSGDWGRLRPDGRLECIGRQDFQVKLRGLRIELEEIERLLAQQSGVRDVAVVVDERENQQQLIAYLTPQRPDQAAKPDTSVLRQALLATLPDYMVPARFIWLEQLPLTVTGKLDRQALRTITVNNTAQPSQHPLQGTEQLLADLWCSVLSLDLHQVQREADFFALGGHSLTATRLASRVAEAFKIELPLSILFEKPLLRQQAEWLDRQMDQVADHHLADRPALQPDNNHQQLSFAQQRLWFLDHLEGASATYNMTAALRLQGKLNRSALQQTFRFLLQRHETLHTCFPLIDGKPTLNVLPIADPLTITELSHLSTTQQAAQVEELIALHAGYTFDLQREALLRLQLLVLNQCEHILLVNMHHIISDGWSVTVFIREWIQAYTAFHAGATPHLSPLPVQYRDYASWQRLWLQGELLERHQHYWQHQLKEIPDLLELPTDFPRPKQSSHKGNRLFTQLDVELSQRINDFSHQHGCTLFMTLLSAFNVLLYRYSQQTDICVGSPIANRTQPNTESLIGFFANTLVLRSQLQPENGFLTLLKQTRQQALGAYAHQDIAFEQLVELLNPARSLSYHPLFQVMFVLQNQDAVTLELPEIQIDYLEQPATTARFDLTLTVTDSAAGLRLQWDYSTDLFRQERIQRMAQHFAHLLNQLLLQPELSLDSLPMLTIADIQQLQSWNATNVQYPQRHQTLTLLFEAQVRKTPNAIAAVYDHQSLNYSQLNMAANRLAYHLIALGITQNHRVGICAERSLELLIGLLGILKAGAAYIPLDPEYPRERLTFMLQDAGLSCLLIQSGLKTRFAPLLQTLQSDGQDKSLVELDQAECFADYPTYNPEPRSGPADLAYVLYTSGSTGRPKGAMNAQQGIVNRLLWMQAEYQLTADDRILQKTPFSFDVSVWEFFWPIITGASLVFAKPGGHRDPLYLSQLIDEQRITTLHFVPSMLSIFLASPVLPQQASLRRVICSGEALATELQQTFFQQLPDIELHNLYGPTEAAIDVTYWQCQPQALLHSVPIGRPVSNTRIYILDSHLQPLAPGLTGELCIAGVQTGVGYLHRAQLTAEKFVETELFGRKERIYRTGDLARWRDDGVLDYLGRIDFQVKLHGLRIELGEIEAELLKLPKVREAVVVLHREDGSERLVAYVTLVAGNEETAQELDGWRQALQAKLPEFMLPANLIVLEQLPLTPNGKLDRKALPTPLPTTSATDSVAPRNTQEQILATIWGELLKCDAPSVYDNFFELGGDSIKAIQMMTALYQAGYQGELRTLFQEPTIAGIAPLLTRRTQAEEATHTHEVVGKVPLSPIQHWFFAQYAGHWSQFNHSLLLTSPNLEADVLQQALQQLTQHHDMLRASYQKAQCTQQDAPKVDVIQSVQSTVAINLETCDLSQFSDPKTALDQHALQAQSQFKLPEAPLLKAILYRMPTCTRLLLIAHHLIIDGVSWRILLADLVQAYTQISKGEMVKLPAKTSSYPDWVNTLSQQFDSLVDSATYHYWQLTSTQSVATLLLDNPNGSKLYKDSKALSFTLDSTLSNNLLTRCHEAYSTRIDDLLLTALVQALSHWSGQARHRISMESHGRQSTELDVSRTVGWFTLLYPVILDLENINDTGRAIMHIKESLRQVPDNGASYGVLRHLNRMSGHDLQVETDILFNYLGQLEHDLGSQHLMLERVGLPGNIDPATPLSHELSISGIFENGCLQIRMNFSPERLWPENVQQLLDEYQTALSRLTEHCLQQQERRLTPSDLSYTGLSMDELDDILEEFS